jgi:UDP-N-acetylglucosamine 2-epimerase (non-hydrolysing)
MSAGTKGAPILCVVGARPNFMKIAPIMRAMKHDAEPLFVKLLHTGQHYDQQMNAQYFDSLGIPNPDINLDVGSGSHAVQTAEIMRRFEPVLDAEKPSAILVVGDVNSTLACALVAAKKGVAVIHVEAGLRSFDRSMPEEVNRVLTDQISDIHNGEKRPGEFGAGRYLSREDSFRRQCHDRFIAPQSWPIGTGD